MDVKLKKLTLENFKGMDKMVIEPDGKSYAVYGPNDSGKTTIADSLSWLFWGKNMKGSAQFEIKTLSPDGEAVHGLLHSVEGVFDIDGKERAFKRTLKEEWTGKRRGLNEEELTGHTTNYHIDDVPCKKKKDFIDEIEQLFDEQTYTLLTDPFFFSDRLHWTKRRETLLQLVGGEVTDETILDESGDKYNDIKENLLRRGYNKYLEYLKGQMESINEELDVIPVRIDENVKDIVDDITSETENKIKHEKAVLESEISVIRDQITKITAESSKAEINRTIDRLELNSSEYVNKAKKDINSKLEEKRASLSMAKTEKGTMEELIKSTERQVSTEKERIEDIENELESLRDEWSEVNATEFALGSDTCPTCNQKLPEEQVDELRAKFNREKASKLDNIDAKGKKKNSDKGKQEVVLKLQTIPKLEGYKQKLEGITKIVSNLEGEIEDIEKSISNKVWEADDEYKDIRYQLDEQKGKLEDFSDSDTDEAKDKATQKINGLQEKLAKIDEDLTNARVVVKAKLKVKGLKAEQKRLAKEKEGIEYLKDLLMQFRTEKINKIEPIVNGMFSKVKFKLFDIKINGNLEECCEAIVDGVPFNSTLNTGAQYMAGIDIIGVLSEKYEISLPIIIDNAEAITSDIETNAQVIRFVAREDEEIEKIAAIKNTKASIVKGTRNKRLLIMEEK